MSGLLDGVTVNTFTRSISVWFSNLPSYLKVVPTTAPSAMDRSFSMVSGRQPVLAKTTVSFAAALALFSTSGLVALPAVAPETQSASGRQLNTVVLAMDSMSLSARYLAASGTMLKSSFTFSAPISCWWRTTSPQLVFHRPKSLA